MLKIDMTKCNGCGVCVQKCLFDALKLDNQLPVVNENCVFCGSCEKECPNEAISIAKQERVAANLMDFHNIWAIMEIDADKKQLKKVSLELLSEARKLASRLGEKFCAVLLCNNTPDRFEHLINEAGCHMAYIIKNEALEIYDTDVFSSIIADIARKYKPSAVLFPATENGRDLAPRVSCALQVGLTADCTSLDIDENNNLVQIRPTYGGNILATIISPNCRPQLASVRPNVLSIIKPKKPYNTKIIYEQLDMKHYPRKVKYIKEIEKDIVYKDISETDIVIVAGYGIGSKENFKKLEKLAVNMNAAIGATRKVVDEGWAPFEIQVGQTGKTVAPDIYIGCGVSGALQHAIGIKNAKLKIAINTDPTAPIFGICDIAVVGDCIKIAEQLFKKISKYGVNIDIEGSEKYV